MRSEFYILDGHQVVPCKDIETWGAFMTPENKRVARTEKNGITVSTVFLGMDHSWGQPGRPIVFETMVFGGEHDQEMDRYHTWKEALEGHKEMCNLVFGEEAE